MMGDAADRADQLIDEHNEDSIAAVRRRVKSGPSLKECVECGEPIPLARQKLGGVCFCTECQEDNERRRERSR